MSAPIHPHTHATPSRLPRATALALLAAGCGAAIAAGPGSEYGTVISSTPVTAQTAVPMQQCRDEPALVQRQNSGGGAIIGALIGGAIGNTIGGGFGRAAATGLGAVAGAAVGDQAEANNNPPLASTVRRCQTVSRLETRLVGYDVVYDYRGQRYSTRLAQDPGEQIPLDVQVTPAGAMAAAPQQGLQQAVQPAVDAAQPTVVYQQPQVVYQQAPVYPAYYSGYPGYPGYYPYGYGGARVVIGVGGGYGGRWHHGPGWR